MEIEFNAELHSRIKKHFIWAICRGKWFYEDNNGNFTGYGEECIAPCSNTLRTTNNGTSLKAYIRIIKKLNTPKGTKFIIANRYKGHDVTITI